MIAKPLVRIVELDLCFVEPKRNDLPRLGEFNPVKVLYPKAGVVLELFEPLPYNVVGNGLLRAAIYRPPPSSGNGSTSSLLAKSSPHALANDAIARSLSGLNVSCCSTSIPFWIASRYPRLPASLHCVAETVCSVSGIGMVPFG